MLASRLGHGLKLSPLQPHSVTDSTDMSDLSGGPANARGFSGELRGLPTTTRLTVPVCHAGCGVNNVDLYTAAVGWTTP